MGAGFCWLIISLTFVVATGVTVIISVFSLLAGFGEIARTHILPQCGACQFKTLILIPVYTQLDVPVPLRVQMRPGGGFAFTAAVEIPKKELFDKGAHFS